MLPHSMNMGPTGLDPQGTAPNLSARMGQLQISQGSVGSGHGTL